uniref:Uncharacterized protein n=1 Tax=Arundo donax TaxID=35708 RepID=A0A0A9H4V9_ARUDO
MFHHTSPWSSMTPLSPNGKKDYNLRYCLWCISFMNSSAATIDANCDQSAAILYHVRCCYLFEIKLA